MEILFYDLPGTIFVLGFTLPLAVELCLQGRIPDPGKSLLAKYKYVKYLICRAIQSKHIQSCYSARSDIVLSL